MLSIVGFLRSQIEMARALSPEQPSPIRLSCFDAEAVLSAIEAADEFLRRENFALGEDVDAAIESLEECISLLYEPDRVAVLPAAATTTALQPSSPKTKRPGSRTGTKQP